MLIEVVGGALMYFRGVMISDFFVDVLTNIKENPSSMLWACALFGTLLFFLRTVISGFDDSDDGDGDGLHDGGAGDDQGMDHNNGHHGTTSLFRFFSIHSITGFFMMFGWVGLACMKQLAYTTTTSMAIALIAGMATMFITGLIFKGASMLVSQGTVFDVKKTIGLVGTVCQQIPHNGHGKVQLEIDGIIREVLAQSQDNQAIESFKLVKVVGTLDYEVVIVEKVNV